MKWFALIGLLAVGISGWVARMALLGIDCKDEYERDEQAALANRRMMLFTVVLVVYCAIMAMWGAEWVFKNCG